MLLSEIANKLGIDADIQKDIDISSVNSLDSASGSEISFLTDISYASKLSETSAGAVIVPLDFTSANTASILIPVANVDQTLEKVLLLFAPELPVPKVRRHPGAFIDSGAEIADDVVVGPGAVIYSGVTIAAGTVIGAGCIIGPNVKIGSGCRLWPNVVINYNCRLGNNVEIHANSTIGTMGFGYRTDNGVHKRIPHIGNVVIEDDVELGANTCIDRAKIGSTVIGIGTKIDNLVQIAHNVQIGPHCIIAGQAGIAGSARLGKYVVLAGQVGVGDHCVIEDFVQVGAQSGVYSGQKIASGAKVLGHPARDIKDYLKQTAYLKKLPEMVQDFKKFIKENNK